jgi:methyl-accepting chemotaxis protein
MTTGTKEMMNETIEETALIFRKSITARFIAVVFLVLLTAQTIGTVAFLIHIRSLFLKELTARMTQSATIIAGVSADAMLRNDYAALDAYLEKAANDTEITSMHIFDSGGNIAREKIRTAAADIASMNPFYLRKPMAVTYPVNSGGAKTGEITVNFTGSSVNDKIQKSMVAIIFYQGVSFMVLGLAIFYFFHRNIRRPIAEINKAIEKITTGDLASAVPDLGGDEIGSIARGVSYLGQRLSLMIAKINGTTANLSTAIRRVDHTYRLASENISSQTAAIREIIRLIRQADKSHKATGQSLEKLLGFSTENVTSLLEMKANADEMSSQTQRLFKATEDSYTVVLQMSQSSKAISNHADGALIAVEDTSSSVIEVSSSVREVETHAGDSSKIAENVREITSGTGMMTVVNAVEGMEAISGEVQKSAEIIQRLGARSVDIQKVLSVIRDVTEQTNLLSLNAAILAAQAGEYGRSFSVVADEIRALSERTAASTREIGGIVQAIQRDIRDAVHSIDSSMLKVEEGNALVIKVGESLGEILTAAVQSSDMTKSIERATAEQSVGLKQITSAVEDIRNVMHSVVKSVKEEENAISYLLEGSGDVKEVAELSKRSAGEQAEGIRLISRNIELANDRINHINTDVSGQEKTNAEIISSMEKINTSGAATIQNMAEVSDSLKTLIREMEDLKEEMGVFKIR